MSSSKSDDKIIIAMIVAVGEGNRVIGFQDGRMPWDRIPEDMAHFRKKTKDYPVIMGRKTFETIPEKFRPLPGRKNIIVTRNKDYEVPDGAVIVHSLEDAFTEAEKENPKKVFVIGGGEIYKIALPHTKQIYVSWVEGDHNGDVFFPEFESEFEVTKGHDLRLENPKVTYRKYRRKNL